MENIVLNRMRNNHTRESHSHVLGCCSRAATVTSETHQFQYLSHEKNIAIKGTLSLFFFFFKKKKTRPGWVFTPNTPLKPIFKILLRLIKFGRNPYISTSSIVCINYVIDTHKQGLSNYILSNNHQ